MSDSADDLPPPSGAPVRPDLPAPPTAEGSGRTSTKRAHRCEICARRPAMKTHARKYTGLVVAGRTTFWKGNACKQCATSLYRDGLTHCLWAGWWGLLAVFWNPVMIARNLDGLRRARALSEPTGVPLADPLVAEPSVALRPRAYVALTIPVLLITGALALVAAMTPEDPLDSLSAGQCVTIQGSGTLEKPVAVDCAKGHTAEVTAVRADIAADSPLCTVETGRYLGGPDGAERFRTVGYQVVRSGRPAGVICMIVAADGSDLRGSQQGSGR